MKTEPRPPTMPALRVAEPPSFVDAAIDRLAPTGYHLDRAKWARLASIGLLPETIAGMDAERDAIGRARRILDVESRLAPGSGLDALCYHLTASGFEGAPLEPIVRHVGASVSALFAIGDPVLAEVRWVGRYVGPDGEWRLARTMARHVLRNYGGMTKAEAAALELLLGAAFVAYVRSSCANPRPSRRLHASSTLVNLEAEEEAGGNSARSGDSLPPIAERTGLIAWISELSNGAALPQAVRGGAALVRLIEPSFPELVTPWRECAERSGAAGAPALKALTIVSPVLAAAVLQAGGIPSAFDPSSALGSLMHFWGTASFETVRFDLSTKAFPWVRRDAAVKAVQTGQ